MADVFFEIGAMIISATVLAYVLRLLKQPMILAYIIAGVLIGPAAWALIDNSATIATMSEIGIAFLLFIVGMEIDFRRLKDTGMTALAVGIGQVAATLAVSFAVVRLLGFELLAAFYIAVAVTFSSTMIVVKLYADKGELDTLHGRIVLGILLVQDVIAILILTILPNITHPSIALLATSLAKGALLFALAWVSARFLIPPLFRSVARSAELLFLSAVSWCLVFAGIAYVLGYSVAIGAFLAGVSLASTTYNTEIISRVRSLRDFFATIFFVSLGMMLAPGEMAGFQQLFFASAVLSALIIIGNPVIVMVLLSLLGHKKRTAFLSGIAVAQISEFSLIVIALGAALGHVAREVVMLITLVAAVTITLSTYMIKYDEQLYARYAGRLAFFERLGGKKENLEYGVRQKRYRAVLCGYNRIGYSILRKLKAMGRNVLVVDFNPELIRRLIKEKQACIYGDVGDAELLEQLHMEGVELLVSTAPMLQDSLLLLRKAKASNEKCVVIVTANQVEDALKLYEAGADYVVLPHFLGGQHVALLLEQFAHDRRQVMMNKVRHMQELHRRRELGHRHPAV